MGFCAERGEDRPNWRVSEFVSLLRPSQSTYCSCAGSLAHDTLDVAQ